MNYRIVIAGGSGFLGSLLADHFARKGTEIVILTRNPRSRTGLVREAYWDGATIGDWTTELEGARALINLAGISVNCRYHARNRKRMLDSRLHSTCVLGEAIGQCSHPPPVWLNSSTATIYRHTFGPAWDETGEIGGCAEAKDIFSVHIAKEWERAFNEASLEKRRKFPPIPRRRKKRRADRFLRPILSRPRIPPGPSLRKKRAFLLPRLLLPKKKNPGRPGSLKERGNETARVSEVLRHFNQGVHFSNQRETSKAIQAYQKVLEVDPKYIEAHNNLGILYQEMGDWEKARKAYQAALEVNPHYEKALINLGILHYLQGHYEDSVDVFQRALAVNPQNGEGYLIITAARMAYPMISVINPGKIKSIDARNKSPLVRRSVFVRR